MSALEFVAAVVGAFFVMGIGVGVIIILAFSATRPNRSPGWSEPPADTGNEDDNCPYWPNRN